MIDQLIDNNTPTKSFSRGEILQNAGQVSSKAYYVKKGLLRSYTIDKKGKEHIYMFASEGWIVSDIESQIFNNKTALFIDAIENSEVYLLDVSEWESTIKNSDDSSIMVNSLLKRVGVMQRRIIALMSSSATERYQSFLQIYPELPNRVPQKMIASYLGITPEGLSRVRKEVVREK